jgi:hypothetical protein
VAHVGTGDIDVSVRNDSDVDEIEDQLTTGEP